MAKTFDPTSLMDDETGTWSFDEVPASEVLSVLADRALTGLLRIWRGDQSDRLFLREGQPVGVDLAEVVAPLGQVLLELGDLNAATYVQAQRSIEEEGRLPGQVYIELGLIGSARLKEVLQIQATRKAYRFVEACHGPFEFSRGLSFLTGFVSAPLDADRLILRSLQRSMSKAEGERFLSDAATAQLRAPDVGLLDVEALGYGRAEERFLSRLADWQTVEELDRFGTLPREQMALLLRFLQLRHRLQLRPAPEKLPFVQTPEEASVFATPEESGVLPRSLAVADALERATPRREKTERISIELAGWNEPQAARTEKSEQAALPSVLVDYAALGVRKKPVAKADVGEEGDEGDEDDDRSKKTSPSIRIRR